MASTKDSITIYKPSTNNDRAIKGVGSDDNEVADVGIVEVNRKSMVKSKDLVKAKTDFLSPKLD